MSLHKTVSKNKPNDPELKVKISRLHLLHHAFGLAYQRSATPLGLGHYAYNTRIPQHSPSPSVPPQFLHMLPDVFPVCRCLTSSRLAAEP
ncbi:hypothetical protein E2C01_083747 [Portunus trituberculatus]|uniref:Uncharacterized protein n=1 Tax=Portunus trituberculatus TaxID=210409 RepID=A0A5B7J4G0_PORTR|nr:hypothetical protein [Portunus trituberculatus]